MKLKTQQLKKFKEYAKLVPSNSLLPICSYLHLEPGMITKHSINSFVTMDIDCAQEMLIDEKILMSFINQTSSDEIDVKLKGKQIIINDTMKDHSPTDDPENFPSIPGWLESEWFELQANALYDISTVSSLLIDDINMPMRSHVFIKNGLIGGGDGVIIYINKHDGVTDIILSKSTAFIIGKFESGSIAQTDNWQFFDAGNVKFGFIKPEINMVDFLPFMTKPDNANTFCMNKSEFITFNDYVTSTMALPNPHGSLEAKDGKLYLDVVDSAYERTITKQLHCVGTCEEFTFNVPQMSRLLKALPDTELTFTQGPKQFYITGETGFTSLIMRVLK